MQIGEVGAAIIAAIIIGIIIASIQEYFKIKQLNQRYPEE